MYLVSYVHHITRPDLKSREFRFLLALHTLSRMAPRMFLESFIQCYRTMSVKLNPHQTLQRELISLPYKSKLVPIDNEDTICDLPSTRGTKTDYGIVPLPL